jgi:hypothetical protein
MNWEESRRYRPWPILRVYSSICLDMWKISMLLILSDHYLCVFAITIITMSLLYIIINAALLTHKISSTAKDTDSLRAKDVYICGILFIST